MSDRHNPPRTRRGYLAGAALLVAVMSPLDRRAGATDPNADPPPELDYAVGGEVDVAGEPRHEPLSLAE